MAKLFFQRVGGTRIVPISLKLVGIFVCLLLLSNFATNFLTLQFTKSQLFSMTNVIMSNHLKEIFSTAGNQFQIYGFTQDRESSLNSIQAAAARELSRPHSVACAFDRAGSLLFAACADPASEIFGGTGGTARAFPDSDALALMNQRGDSGIMDGSLHFATSAGEYFGVYKYQSDWQCYFVRAELRKDITHSTLIVLGIISLVIVVVVGGFLAAGLYMFRTVLATVKRITDSLYRMQEVQQLSLIDLSGAPNDDITYLAASFNSLSATINNLLGIFQKFVSKDLVAKAYAEHAVRLEGRRRNLTMLFSDIKSFTNRTELLGNDIIDLLNVHYDRVIHTVHEHNGIIGSIIGDAVLAVFGVESAGGAAGALEPSDGSGSCASPAEQAVQAVETAWGITRATAELREKMHARRTQLARALTDAEERVYQAVLIDVGVGIDGGTVFYGNIGSVKYMANTVIGDNVNSASRIEGLTRVYRLPVLVSGYVRDEIRSLPEEAERYTFFEIDTVQVKGRDSGTKVYFPLPRRPEGDVPAELKKLAEELAQ